MMEIEILGENGAWYKVGNASCFPHNKERPSIVFKANFKMRLALKIFTLKCEKWWLSGKLGVNVCWA